MGKRKRFGGGRGGRNDDPGRPKKERTNNYDDIAQTNYLYETYYYELGVASEDERTAFWEALRRELPNSFRFAGSKANALSVQKLLISRYVPRLTNIIHEGEPVAPPAPLPWYPDNLAWQMTSSKRVVRKSPPFAEFQKFLVSETSVGHMSRQEAVSMIPPLLLDVRPGMTVLDLCAAPGSKAAQLLEMVHGGEEARVRKAARQIKEADGRQVSPDPEEIEREIQEEAREDAYPDDGRATGLLIANDVDHKRVYMLVHQLKRLSSANLIVTNHDATMFPSIKLPDSPSLPNGSPPQAKYLKFDRILADVPCSGDGTPRKNIMVWHKWNPANALGLHAPQTRMLVRALQMLKVGGRVVYSTCSMNPVENEAVVAAAIWRCGGSTHVGIVSCEGQLPKLKRRPGLTSWIVMDKAGKTWSSWAEVERVREENIEEGLDPRSGLSKLSPTFFAPAEADDQLPLERCMRVYSHLQDTGSFFIAVLEKKKEIRALREAPSKAPVAPKFESNTNGPAPVTAIVDEIEAKAENNIPTLDPVDAVDTFMADAAQATESFPPSTPDGEDGNALDHGLPPKRQLDAPQDDFLSPTKRPKVETEEGTADAASTASVPATNPTMSSLAPRADLINRKKTSAPVEEPFKYLPASHPILRGIRAFYGLHERFPADRFMVRNAAAQPAKAIYYSSPLARDLLTANEAAGIKFVQSGVRMFVKQEVQRPDVCKWRIQSEGLPLLDPWVGEHRVRRLRSRAVLRELLVEMFPKVDGEGAKEWGAFGAEMRASGMGCYVLRVEPGAGAGADAVEERMVLPLWKGIMSVNLMLPKEDRKAMLLRLFDEDVPLLDHSQQKNKKAQREQSQDGEGNERRNSSSGAEDDGDAIDGSGQNIEIVLDNSGLLRPGGAADKAETAENTEVAPQEIVGENDAGKLALATNDLKREAELKADVARYGKDELDLRRTAEEDIARSS